MGTRKNDESSGDGAIVYIISCARCDESLRLNQEGGGTSPAFICPRCGEVWEIVAKFPGIRKDG